MTASASSSASSARDVPPNRQLGPDGRVDRLTWRLAWANLAAQLLIIATGGAVRLTGSGLGCSQWPMCEPGSFIPRHHEAMTFHPYVEFGNRTVTGVLLVIAVALLWATWRRQPTASRPRIIKVLAAAPLALVVLQGLVGGATVLIDLHPAIVGSHMLVSLALVAVSAYLLLRLRSADGPARSRLGSGQRLLATGAATVASVTLVLGVITTGAGPHSGDAEAPYRWALDPVAVSRIHAWTVWVFLALLLATLLTLHTSHRQQQRAISAWWWLLGATAAQGAIGYMQYFTGLPELLVGAHMVGSGVLVIMLVAAMGSLYTREELPARELGEPEHPATPQQPTGCEQPTEGPQPGEEPQSSEALAGLSASRQHPGAEEPASPGLGH